MRNTKVRPEERVGGNPAPAQAGGALGLALRFQIRLARLGMKLFNACVRLVVLLLFRNRSTGHPSAILVLRTGTIGDFVCGIPALAFLRRRYPQARICVLTTASGTVKYWTKGFTAGARILEGNELVDELILFEGSHLRSLTGVLQLRCKIKELNPDLTFIIPQSPERFTGLLKKIFFLRLVGVRANMSGYRREKTFSFLAKAQFMDGGYDHQVISALKAVGADSSEPVEFYFTVPQSARERVQALWAGHGLDSRATVIAIFVGGKFDHKRWPLENFAALCRELVRDPKVALVLVGGPGEAELASQLAGIVAGPLVNLAGQTKLVETAEVLRRCALYIGNDSGPAHVAAAVGTPCLTLFSAIVFPGIWEPWGEGNISLRRRVACEFCLCEDHCPRGTMECIRQITVDEVLAVIRERWLKLPDSNQPGTATDAHGSGVGTGKAAAG